MLGAMQDWQLRIPYFLDHAAREHGSREIVTVWADGSETRTNWAGIRRDALKLAQALRRMGIRKGDRVATLAFNHARHLVALYGIVGSGAVVHTVNPRLFDDQLDYIVNHAEDRIIIYDAALQPLVDRMKPLWPTVEHYVCFDSGEHAPHFSDWIGAEDGDTAWAEGDEREPAMLCYTSGTTGNPKGVLYEHRSMVLHTLMSLGAGSLAVEARSAALPIVPMYHANNWGFPWAGAAAGAKLVYSAANDPDVLCRLMTEEGITHVAGVPTVFLMMLQYLDANDREMPPIQRVICGGSAMPPVVIERFLRAGVQVIHAWGMTETSPMAAISYESEGWEALTIEEQVQFKLRAGRPPFGCELRTVSLDDPNVVLPRDGVTTGALQVRGQWVLKRYFKAEQDATGPDQWFDTGDVATIHPDGSVQLTDRTKDVIKSGGEWISSVELENAALAHPAVAEAAAIGVYHPKWDERPILVVVRKPGRECCAEDLRTLLASKVAKWWLPDAVEFVDEIPHTGTGKISKKDLRDQFRDYRLAG